MTIRIIQPDIRYPTDIILLISESVIRMNYSNSYPKIVYESLFKSFRSIGREISVLFTTLFFHRDGSHRVVLDVAWTDVEFNLSIGFYFYFSLQYCSIRCINVLRSFLRAYQNELCFLTCGHCKSSWHSEKLCVLVIFTSPLF